MKWRDIIIEKRGARCVLIGAQDLRELEGESHHPLGTCNNVTMETELECKFSLKYDLVKKYSCTLIYELRELIAIYDNGELV